MADYTNVQSGCTLILTDSFRKLYYLAMYSLTKTDHYHDVPFERFDSHAEKNIYDRFLERVVFPVIWVIEHPIAQKYGNHKHYTKPDLTPEVCNKIFNDVREKSMHPRCSSIEDFDVQFDWIADALEIAGKPLEGAMGPEEGEDGDAEFTDTEISSMKDKVQDYSNLKSICQLEVSPSLRRLYYLGIFFDIYDTLDKDGEIKNISDFGEKAIDYFGRAMMFNKLCDHCIFKMLDYIPHPLTKKYADSSKNELFDPTPSFVDKIVSEVKEFESLNVTPEGFDTEFSAFIEMCESNKCYKETMSAETTSAE